MAEEFKIGEMTINGETYVNKKDALHVISQMKTKYFDGKEPGYMQEKKGKRLAAYLALNHFGAVLTRPEREKYIHDNITHQKLIIASVKMEKQETFFYFKGWCRHVPGEEGRAVPIFTEDPTEAMEYENENAALLTIAEIKANYHTMELAIFPRGRVRIATGLRRLHEEYGWPQGREQQDVIDDELSWINKDAD